MAEMRVPDWGVNLSRFRLPIMLTTGTGFMGKRMSEVDSVRYESAVRGGRYIKWKIIRAGT